MNKKLSVITITYNNHEELVRTLESIPHHVQSVVVNGGNDERTLDFLQSDKRISLSEKDKGISDAFNKGLSLSTGEYVVFLNSGDILVDKEYYEEAISILETKKDVGFIHADLLYVDQFAGEVKLKSGDSLPRMPFPHPTLVVRKKIINEIGGFDLRYKIAMDLDFVYRLIASGARGHYIPRMVVRMNGQGISSRNYFKLYSEVMQIVWRRKDISFNSLSYLLVNGLMMIAKMALLALGGNLLLGKYRKKRYKINR